MKHLHKVILSLVLAALVGTGISGCGSMKPQDFEKESLQLVPEQYFAGKTRGVGVFFDRFGDLKTSFTVDLDGSWDKESGVLTLTEFLKYANGETLNRTYIIQKRTEHLYSVATKDIEGDATIEAYGNTMKWTYDLNQKIDDSTVLLHFNDWMHLQPDGIILNRAYASKFGVGLGEVFMSVRRVS